MSELIEADFFYGPVNGSFPQQFYRAIVFGWNVEAIEHLPYGGWVSKKYKNQEKEGEEAEAVETAFILNASLVFEQNRKEKNHVGSRGKRKQKLEGKLRAGFQLQTTAFLMGHLH